MNPPFKAAAVANAFLDIQKEDDGKFPPIDHMKLQKLLYYAQAWWLAGTGGSLLFSEVIEAWPWGPVVRDIYTQFGDFGRRPIVGRRACEFVRNGLLDYHFQEPQKVQGEEYKFLKRVWDTHKSFTGIQLSNATHFSGEPWTIIKEKYGSLESRPPIPNELICDVFKRKLSA